MPASEDPLGLLEELKQRYGVEESDPLLGPSVIIPNNEYSPRWTRLLSEAGFKIFSGERYGRVAWIIPLKARPNNPGPDLTKDPLDGLQGDPETGTKSEVGRGRGCITGRPWTPEEDNLLVTMLDQGKGPAEIARDLAGQLGRTEEAIRGRVRKLRRRRRVGSESVPAPEPPLEAAPEPTSEPEPELGAEDLRHLFESALLLSEDPQHKPALKLIIEACLKLV